jgi:hypothetical protein
MNTQSFLTSSAAAVLIVAGVAGTAVAGSLDAAPAVTARTPVPTSAPPSLTSITPSLLTPALSDVRAAPQPQQPVAAPPAAAAPSQNR